MLQLARNKKDQEVIQRGVWMALEGAAWIVTTVARIAAPARELDVFPHRGHEAGRHWSHRAAYLSAPGWCFIEFGGWTIEVTWQTREEMAKARAQAAERKEEEARAG